MGVGRELVRRAVVDEPLSVRRYRHRVHGVVNGKHRRRRRRAETVADNPRAGTAVDLARVVQVQRAVTLVSVDWSAAVRRVCQNEYTVVRTRTRRLVQHFRRLARRQR